MTKKFFFTVTALFLVSQAAQAEECPKLNMAHTLGFKIDRNFKDDTGRKWQYEPDSEEMDFRKDLKLWENKIVSKGHGATRSPNLVCQYDVEDNETDAVLYGFNLVQQK